MMGEEAPKTRRATHERRVINLWNCCILLVNLFKLLLIPLSTSCFYSNLLRVWFHGLYFIVLKKGTEHSVSDLPAELQHVKNNMFFRCDVSLVAKGNGFWHLLKIHLVKTCNMLNQNLHMLADSKCKYQQALYSLLLSHKTVCTVNSNIVQVG